MLVALIVSGFVAGLAPGPVSAEPPGARVATRAVHQVVIFGHSVKGRALRAYRVGDPASPNKVVVLATMHGDETGPARVLMNLINGAPVTGADIWLVPYLNRDGMARHT